MDANLWTGVTQTLRSHHRPPLQVAFLGVLQYKPYLAFEMLGGVNVDPEFLRGVACLLLYAQELGTSLQSNSVPSTNFCMVI